MPSLTEVAVTVTLPPAGTADGAWYEVGTLLAIGSGLNEPHCCAGAHVNCTPSFFRSLLTTAAIPTVALVASPAGGGNEVLNAIEIGGF